MRKRLSDHMTTVTDLVCADNSLPMVHCSWGDKFLDDEKLDTLYPGAYKVINVFHR